ncbi:protein phosphatase 2C family protein [Actinidia rufa]|uniref:protein-serine/threonine phosphatase n=1 Tax=Actinidia rufa TaxID=165716 RepID=A0A7J0GTF5_9ERIC|nr:protein phosphatase 2C family protein [Actinidia rufa]
MGCVQGKCCGEYPKSSDGDNREFQELGAYSSHGRHILANRSLEFVLVPSHNLRLEYSFLTQRGYYPEMPDKENQDSFCIKKQIQGNPNIHFFGVFDGHGQFGTQCSNFVKDRLVEILSGDPALLGNPVKAYNSAFLTTNEELHNSEIDDTMSGTTAITVLVMGDTLYVGNVGDSRGLVKLCGARVLSVEQVEGLKDPGIQTWGDEETEGSDPPRLWKVSTVQLTPDHLFFVIASDGVFEFLSSQTVVEMVTRYTDPRDACSAIAAESYKLWLEHEHRTDDITIIVVHIKELFNSGAHAATIRNGTSIQPAALKMQRGTPNTFVHPRPEFLRPARIPEPSAL